MQKDEQTRQGALAMPSEVQIRNVDNRSAVHTRRIVLLLGRKSRSGADGEADLRALLAAEGYEVLNDADDPRGQLNPNAIVREFADRADAVLIGGGDGSVNKVLESLVETQLPFCVIPLGTANNLARTMQIAPGAETTLRTLRGGSPCAIDLGLANGKYFVNVAGIGLSARINASTPSHWKKRFGPLAFAISAFKLARSMVPFRVRMECDGSVYAGRTLQISIINGRYFGNGLSISQEHTLQDNELAAFSIRTRRWWEAIFLIPAFLTGRVRDSEKVLLLRGKRIRIETKRPMKVDLDGDIQTHTPLEVSVVPAAARMLCPAESVAASA